MSELRQKTLNIMGQLKIEDRKRLGQYFTPEHIRHVAFNTLPQYDFKKILEPSFGTGEFLEDLALRYPDSAIDGYEIDPALFNEMAWDKGTLTLGDFLKNDIPDDTYDLVIGNPPYFQVQEYDQKFNTVVNGRPNIFSFFFQEGIRVLRDGGWLVYVIPTSMCTGKYFLNLRKHIEEYCGVKAIVNFDDSEFENALQSVIVLTLQKGFESQKNLVYGDDFKFNYNGDDIIEKSQSGKTLNQLGFHVKTGNLVWNQHKEELTDVAEDNIKLLWSHNVSKENILTDQTKKPQYVLNRMRDKITPYQAPAIVAKRTLGAVGKGTLNACLIESGEFYAENHLNVITHKDHTQLPVLLNELTKPSTSELARRITGNTQLSKTELMYLLPLAL
jgi:SAM-dependent methyltransferase